MKKRSGMTMIEIILYLALVSIFVVSLTYFWSLLMQSQIKNRVVTEVHNQANLLAGQITQTIRNASSINSPLAGNSAASLSLAMSSAPLSPTIFSLSSGSVQVQEGASAAVALTSNRVVVTALNFQNLSRSDTRGNIRFSFTIKYNNPGSNNMFDYQQTYYGAASLR